MVRRAIILGKEGRAALQENFHAAQATVSNALRFARPQSELCAKIRNYACNEMNGLLVEWNENDEGTKARS
jgi:hypothetical protein